MVIRLQDPMDDLLNRKRTIDMQDPYATMDKQEQSEREAAASAYAGENEKHFIDYLNDCIKQSVDAQREIRKIQGDCWNAYNENEPLSYQDKESWQSRIIVPKPFQTVQFGAAAIKKAFSPNFLSIENAKDDKAKDFWQKVMTFYLDKLRANFVTRFHDASIMALSVGQSLDMKARWVPGKGLQYSLIEPWKIQRDPYALSRDSQSGMFWIHQEWLDYFTLLEGERVGRYSGVSKVREFETGGEDANNPFMTKEAIQARKEMVFERSQFRKLVLTSEFWGQVLDPRGELLLPDAKFTAAAGRIIQAPKKQPYRNIRWPSVSFSPLPNILRFGGRGLLEGVLTIWEAMCNIMCLHHDYLQWIVNPPNEINVSGLVNPDDVVSIPGKDFLVKDTLHGQSVVRPVQRRSRTNDVLGNMQFYDQQFQRGAFVTDAVQGLPGYRKDITFRESAMLMDQAMAVFGLMGQNVEGGAIDAIVAGMAVIEEYAAWEDYLTIFTREELTEYGMIPNPEAHNGVSGTPRLDGNFHISGIQALLRDNETIKNLREIIIPLSQSADYKPYIRPYRILKSIETRVNLRDEEVIVGDKEAELIQIQQQLAGAKQAESLENLQFLQEALGIADLMEKLNEIQVNDIQGLVQEINAIKQQVLGGPIEEAA